MTSFEKGYQTFAAKAGVDFSAFEAAGYVSDIEEAINLVQLDINALLGDGRDIGYLKGVVAEHWHGGVFNVNSVIKGTEIRAIVPQDNGLADIILPDGSKVQVKYYYNGDASAKEQAKTLYERYMEYCRNYQRNHDGRNPEKTLEQYISEYNKKNNTELGQHDPYYDGQMRLVPADQLKDAEAWLKDKLKRELDPELKQRYQDALENLSDRIEMDGIESIPLDEKTAKDIAKSLKDDGFDPADFGLTTEELLDWNDIMKQANKAGLSAAIISVVLEVAPHLFEIIMKSLREDGVDPDDFMRLGFAALKGTALGYIRGSVSSAITVSCKAGKLGPLLKNTDPTIIGAIVVLTMSTIENAILMALGRISNHEFANKCVESLFTVSCSLAVGMAAKKAMAKFAGAALQTLLPQLPVVGYMIGSFIGGILGTFAYKTANSCVMSYCIESGCTFFGLVKQNYTLPKEIMEQLGLEIFEYEPFEFESLEFEPFEFEPFRFEPFEYTPINIRLISRGVIGVNTVGFILQ